MTCLEQIIYILLRGFAIGVFVSAPMGPVGVLCIQRTLNKGRWVGFCTGIGASVSDLIYCLLTGFGMSLVSDFIENKRDLLQISGSVVLLVYAILLIKNNPAKSLRHSSNNKSTLWHNGITGFLLTASTPFILFLIVGLFARFNFTLPEFKFYHYIVGYAFIVVGAITWWLTITTLVNRLRKHFTVRTLWHINRFIGFVIFIMSLVGLITGLKSILNLYFPI